MSPALRRPSILAIMVIAACCLVGGLLGTGVLADHRLPDEQLRTFSHVLSLIESEYIEDTDTEELVENAIRGMLKTLDPHSNYLTPEEFREMREEQRGEFSGLGIQIAKRSPDQPLTIIAPIEGTPASRAGLQAGDIISRIDGEETLDMTVRDAVKLLKGTRGTKVTITVQRPSENSQFDVTIVRDIIPITSIRVAFMLEPEVGYIHITNFTSTTTKELDEALADLNKRGMTKLILDLRGNPGGLLQQAVTVAERFIPEGKLLVYTRGRVDNSDQDYHAGNGVGRYEGALIVMVDNGSASASEIVSGAIQDHDRGLVIGETTFGKGLVQRVLELSNGGALAVTTAKYYTPSGRLIQRDYSDPEQYILEGTFALQEDDETDPKANADVHYTASGREVYGGGGITPDHIVKARRMPALVSRMLLKNLFLDFSARYLASNSDIPADFTISDELIGSFKSFLEDREFSFDSEAFENDRETIALRLKAQIARVHWGVEAQSRILAAADPQIQKALASFGEAAALARRGREGSQGSEEFAELLAEDTAE